MEENNETGKDYRFDEGHDPNKPAEYWFQEPPEGKTLFVVYYSQACRWSRCLGCNLPSLMSGKHVRFDSLMSQVDHLLDIPEVKANSKGIRKVIVSNNGSILDEETFSSTALMYLVARLNQNFPNMSTLSLETRPEFVDIEELEFISRALKEGDSPTSLELAIGFEAFDEKIRNDIFQKGLSLKVFERTVDLLARHDFSLKCYFMLKPAPGMSDEEAIEDIHKAIDYLSGLSAAHGIKINMHLNPTYAATGTALERSFVNGEYSPPLLMDVARAAIHGKEKSISIFLGLSDEGLACEGGSFIRPGDDAVLHELSLFNKTGDYGILERIINNG